MLAAGHFAVTTECGPPQGAAPDAILEKGKLLDPVADGLNTTDNQTAVVRLSSMASAALLTQIGAEPVMQMVTRDRNRLALQADLLGAAALGIQNVLCLTGDHQSFGGRSAQGVFDLDSMHLLHAARLMRDEGRLLDGTILDSRPNLFLGAAANPFAHPFKMRIIRLAKKIQAGAQFIQTQCVFNRALFEKWLNAAEAEGLTERVRILAGVTPLKSVRMARYMKDRVAGIDLPEELIQRMEGASDPAAEGIRMAVETIDWLKNLKGVAGVHLMAIGWESRVPEILESAGLLPRPNVAGPAN
jgi:methylenetetrahydrofolate reductase (NADPH)